jgi:predicted nucleic acid-binding protein
LKNVFVETNFLIDLLRPFPTRAASALFARAGKDISLHLPWVSIAEAKRTITSKIVDEDLGFAKHVSKFGVSLLKNGTLSTSEMSTIQTFEQHIKTVRAAALKSVSTDVDNAVSRIDVIPPSHGVVNKTLSLYPIKSLPPFDEMVLGAVLFRAEELKTRGERNLYFCNANFRDFGPTSGSLIGDAYLACGLTYLSDFAVP